MTIDKNSTPTREEVDLLKQSWSQDPHWDIEDTEGFEAYRDELLAFSNEMQAKWKAEEEERKAREQKRLEGCAKELGCSVGLVRYIESLEWRIRKIEATEEDIVF